MDSDLTGRRAFVSGSTQGIGYAIANALLAEGAHVTVHGRTPERVDDAVTGLRRQHPGASVSGVAADVASGADMRMLAERMGEVDVLVNNVGMFGVGDFFDVDDAAWSTYLDVNLMSGVRLSRAALPGMLARGAGRILFVSSESGVDVPGDMIPYGVTKAGMVALANGLAKLTRGTGVTVNSILGGPTWSDGVAEAVRQVAAAQGVDVEQMRSVIASRRPTSLVGRFLEPEEIAHLAVYLASPLSSATNGAALRADGGVLTTTL